MNWLIYGMVYLGSALMVYNIYSFVEYVRELQEKEDWGKERSVLYIPIVLLVLFLLGYLAVGIFGKPDLIISGILFGGSIFVFVMARLLHFITARVQENEQLEAKLTAAEESSKAKTAFLSSVSHEMRTPMNAVIGLDVIALKRPDLHPETRRHLEMIGINANHLMSLIENILDMSDLESGQFVLKQNTFSLYDLLDMINLIMRKQCNGKGLLYQSSVIGKLDDYYVGDQRKLRQVLVSVLDNAVKYTPKPGTVTFFAEQTGSGENSRTLRFVINDTGVGIDKEFLPDLFKSFSRENNTSTDKYGGLGLSLAITKNIVELMNGTIEVESDKEIGTTFTVTVVLAPSDRKADDNSHANKAPLSETENQEAEPAARETGEKEPEPPAQETVEKEPGSVPHSVTEQTEKEQKNGLRVLVVEDIDLNAEILIDLLDMEEISAERAENGKIAVEKFSENPENYYDAILMDLRMPIMDGLDAARNIRALDRPDAAKVPIIAVSANASEADRQNVIKAGMNSHLAKPVDSDQLIETLRNLLAAKMKTE